VAAVQTSSLAASTLTRDTSNGALRYGTWLAEVDGVRGLAIFLVLVFHFGTMVEAAPGSLAAYVVAPLRLAWSGVDLFLILSGYLIGGILLDVKASPRFFSTFYIRRACRIFPLYYALLATFVVGLSLYREGAVRSDWLFGEAGSFLVYGLFVQNFWMITHPSINWMSVTWSLAIEEQFYWSLPLLVRFTSRRVLTLLLAVAVAAALALRVQVYFAGETGPLGTYLLPYCRMDELAVGVLIAILHRNAAAWAFVVANRRWLKLAIVPLTAGMVFLTLRAYSSGSVILSTIGYTLIAAFFACLLLLVLTNRHGIAAQVARLRPLRWLGVRCFGLYLLHIPILGLVYQFVLNRPPALTSLMDLPVSLLALALTLGLAALSWRYLEHPFVRSGHRATY
jgi:peptidoglycan/LPS O-acetylase OafA/YrhL